MAPDRWYLILLATCSLLGACAPAASTGSDSETDGDPSWPPPVCDMEVSPFLQMDCLEEIRLVCNEHDQENTCTATTPLVFSDGSYRIDCFWAKTVTFSDVSSCAVDSVAGRCEAAFPDTLCGDDCAGAPSPPNSVLFAIESENALMEICGGPVGPWTALDSQETYAIGCGPGDPAPPLCNCGSVACEAG